MSNAPTTPVTSLLSVLFKGTTIEAVKHEGEFYVVVRRICENLGLHLQAQHAKLKEKPWAVIRMIRTTGPDSKEYEALCLSLKSLPAWLFSINATKVKEELRPTLELYQREAADFLYRHLFGLDQQPASAPRPGGIDRAVFDELQKILKQANTAKTVIDDNVREIEYMRISVSRDLTKLHSMIEQVEEHEALLFDHAGHINEINAWIDAHGDNLDKLAFDQAQFDALKRMVADLRADLRRPSQARSTPPAEVSGGLAEVVLQQLLEAGGPLLRKVIHEVLVASVLGAKVGGGS